MLVPRVRGGAGRKRKAVGLLTHVVLPECATKLQALFSRGFTLKTLYEGLEAEDCERILEGVKNSVGGVVGRSQRVLLCCPDFVECQDMFLIP